jgi:transketolase
MSLEAGVTTGWYKYVDYTYGIDQFGESAKMVDIKTHFRFTLENIVEFITLHILQ